MKKALQIEDITEISACSSFHKVIRIIDASLILVGTIPFFALLLDLSTGAAVPDLFSRRRFVTLGFYPIGTSGPYDFMPALFEFEFCKIVSRFDRGFVDCSCRFGRV